MAVLIELSLVRSELSTMREPSFTVSPPMIAGSTLIFRSTSLPPVTDFSALLSASRCAPDSVSATAGTLPNNACADGRYVSIAPIEKKFRVVLLDKLREWQARQPAPFAWQHGETLLFLGSELNLCLAEGARRAQPLLEDDALVVRLPDPADVAAVRRKLEQWYRAEAQRHFLQRLAHYAGRMGLALPSLALSGARSRWGSCNSRGEIRLSWRLIQAPISQIDYVVVHELAHIRELNHSPRFWSIVREYLPHYEAAHRALKASGERYHRF